MYVRVKVRIVNAAAVGDVVRLHREHQGQTGRKHSRDVGDEQNRGRLAVRRQKERHAQVPSVFDSVRQVAAGRKTLRHSVGRTDAQVRCVLHFPSAGNVTF